MWLSFTMWNVICTLYVCVCIMCLYTQVCIIYLYTQMSFRVNSSWAVLFVYFKLFKLCWVFVAAPRLSFVALSGGYSPIVISKMLTAFLASLAVEDRHRQAGFNSSHAKGLVRPAARGILPDQGQARVPCVGRRIHIHWTTTEVLFCCFYTSRVCFW